MLTKLDVLEGGGFPPLIVAVATAANQNRVLGEVLAEAVKVILQTLTQLPLRSVSTYICSQVCCASAECQMEVIHQRSRTALHEAFKWYSLKLKQ